MFDLFKIKVWESMTAMRRISSINAENANSSEQAHILFD